MTNVSAASRSLGNTLTECVGRLARLGTEAAFLHRRGVRIECWSYVQVAETEHRFAHELAARAIALGDRVMIRAENSPAWVAAFCGCLLCGAAVVPLDAPSAPDFVERVRPQVAAQLLLLTEAETAERAGGLHVPLLLSCRSRDCCVG